MEGLEAQQLWEHVALVTLRLHGEASDRCLTEFAVVCQQLWLEWELDDADEWIESAGLRFAPEIGASAEEGRARSPRCLTLSESVGEQTSTGTSLASGGALSACAKEDRSKKCRLRLVCMPRRRWNKQVESLRLRSWTDTAQWAGPCR